MKKTIINAISAALILLAATSCNGWLEAVSTTQIEGYKLFEEKMGYYDALTGVYLDMGKSHAYGQYITSMLPDLAVYPYITSTLTTMSMWQTHSYKTATVQSTVTNLWVTCYNIIANINFELSQLEQHRSLFSEELEYDLIRGELLGLRAYVHLDLMRLLGVAHPADAANSSKVTIPYVTEYSKNVTPQLSYAETRKLLMSDIEEALKCLEDDPVRGKRTEAFQNAANSEGYWNHRTKHMNYYSALALAARAHQWFDEPSIAAEYAQKAAEGALQAAAVTWCNHDAAVNETDRLKIDLTFSSEHLFSLEVTELYSNAYVFYVASSNGGILLNTPFIDEVAFPVVDSETGALSGREDIRGPLVLLSRTNVGYVNYKLYGSASRTVPFRNRMPMLRLSEMYYIMAENHILQGEPEKALDCLDAVRHARGITTDLPDTKDAMKELTLEYYREFINEGQLIYWLKHTDLKYDMGKGYFDLAPEHLTFPYPQGEIAYGRIQEL